MKTAIVRTRISNYIHEFEESVDRVITTQEFIDMLPEIYIKLTKDELKPLGTITYQQFELASRIGYKYSNLPKLQREHMIREECSQYGG